MNLRAVDPKPMTKAVLNGPWFPWLGAPTRRKSGRADGSPRLTFGPLELAQLWPYGPYGFENGAIQ